LIWRAVGLGNLEEARAINSNIQGIFGVDHVALGMNLLGGENPRTGTHHEARWCQGVGTRLAARLSHVLIKQIFEVGAIALKPGGINVGQVVGNHAHALLLRIEAGLGNPE